jgi:hypothetical protein
MTPRFLKALVPFAAVAFAIMPITAAAVTVAGSSTYTAQRGAGGPATAPDANGNSFASFADGGPVTGAFTGSMGWRINYVLHTQTGLVDGTGTVVCDPCTVAGLSGTATLAVTISGHGSLVTCGTNAVCISWTIAGGAWTVSSATGALAGLIGSGTWTQSGPNRLLVTASSSCDNDGDDDDECDD